MTINQEVNKNNNTFEQFFVTTKIKLKLYK